MSDASTNPILLRQLLARLQTIDNAELRRFTGLHPADATKTLTGLRDEGLFVSAGLGPATSYSLSPKAQTVLEEVRRTAATADQPDLFEIELASPVIGRADLDRSRESFAKREPSFDNKQAELDNSRPEQQPPTPSTVPMPASFPGPSAEWESLLTATLKVRQKSRVEVSTIEAAVLDTCAHRPLSVAELSMLLGKSKPRIRQVVQTLRKRGQLRYAHPDAQTSPNQRYIAASPDQ